MRLCTGIAGYELSALERTRLIQDPGREVILFRRNIRDRIQLRRLIASLHNLGTTVGIDHEGGRVHRFANDFAGVTHLPAMQEWRSGGAPERRIRQNAAILAGELKALGFDHMYAPVADLSVGHLPTTVIGDRAFSGSPRQVADNICSFLEGSAGFGLSRCIKHFPGHGRYRIDSHLGLPWSHQTYEHWLESDAVPFREAATVGVERIMIAHLRWPSVSNLPSWRDSKIVQLARALCGSTIAVLTDDLAMGAVGRYQHPTELLAAVAAAGYDRALLCAADATGSTRF